MTDEQSTWEILMSRWVYRGLKTGVVTTLYPVQQETAPGCTPGLPMGQTMSVAQGKQLEKLCPTGAIQARGDRVTVDYRRCIHCYRCAREGEHPLPWQNGYEWAYPNPVLEAGSNDLASAFTRSIHIKVVDAGDCGACLHEVRKLANPYYNMHRLGFFLTPTPRHADILLVVGTVTDHLRLTLEKTYEAMPGPKKVVAVGACALSGGIFGTSFVCGSNVRDVIPVDVEVPGQPPPPLAILHGLLLAVGRRPAGNELSAPSNVEATP
jgi:Ni,Fe-hydrogenase III small subunit/ferredoxin-like protein FixX